MKVSDFDFNLPRELIALRPVCPRDAARLLVVSEAGLSDRRFVDLPDLLGPGDLLVFNDTRVLPARLKGRRGAAHIELTLHQRDGDATWRAFARPAKRLRPGDVIDLADGLGAEVISRQEGEVIIRFNLSGQRLDKKVEIVGQMPLPPYIAGRRAPDARDRADYQTIFAARTGAVAAPTAGLHFTQDLLGRFDQAGIDRVAVTLHVGAGTFLPVKAEDTGDHVMHAEWGQITAQAAARINAVRAVGGRIVAVGTTALRILETAADKDGRMAAFEGETDIFITPGYRFRAVDLLITNFHLPRSTLFMLVTAFSGLERMKRAYAHAIARNYRFFSYGDACLLGPLGREGGA